MMSLKMWLHLKLIFFPGEILKMTHLARGRDITDGSLQIDTIARGNIPALPDNTNIMLLPYHEDYIQTGPGLFTFHRFPSGIV